MALNSRHAHRNLSLYLWKDDKLQTTQGGTPEVLHQYDRHRTLAKYGCVAVPRPVVALGVRRPSPRQPHQAWPLQTCTAVPLYVL